eukprot:Platyproteum_vivax@DN4602_c0_g1_i3.p1
MVQEDVLCDVCREVAFQYVCPRCDAPYCSVKCYKNHNNKCTEAFYEANVKEQLATLQPCKESVKEFKDTLQALDALEPVWNETDLDEDIDDERRAQLLDLAQRDLLTKDMLTPQEMQMFKEALKDGQIQAHLTPYSPWWTQVVIEEWELCVVDHICCVEGVRTAHDSSVYIVLQLIYAYVHSMRMFDGDLRNAGAQESLIHLCPALRNSKKKSKRCKGSHTSKSKEEELGTPKDKTQHVYTLDEVVHDGLRLANLPPTLEKKMAVNCLCW